MSKIVNFHPNEAPLRFNVHSSFGYSNFLIFKERHNDVHTYQMALLNRAWDNGMTVRIWYQDHDCYTYDEFTHGQVVCDKFLRNEHNLLKLWISGALGEHTVTGFKTGRTEPRTLWPCIIGGPTLTPFE